MAGISSTALNGAVKNKRGYNGNELQSNEFSDGSGLEAYDFNARTYNQQLGRFIQIDPLLDEDRQIGLTPYHFSYNNPIAFSDPDGKCPVCPAIPYIIEGVEIVTAAIVSYVAAKEGAPIVLDAVRNNQLSSPSASSLHSVSNNSFAWDPSYATQLRISSSNTGKPKGSANEKVKEKIEIGKEAHRQEQAEILKEDPGAEIEKTIQLKDGTVVRKDAILTDGTPVIIKPKTATGIKAAEKRVKLLKDNKEKDPKVRYYDPQNPKYKPGSPSYIGPKNGGGGW